MAISGNGQNQQEPSQTPQQAPELYTAKQFDENAYRNQLLQTEHGTKASKWDRFKFNRWMNSDEGQQALQKAKTQHNESEQQKENQSWDAHTAYYKDKLKSSAQSVWDAFAAYDKKYAPQVQDQSKPVAEETKAVLKPKIKTDEQWLATAKQYGFSSLDDVKKWQSENGLVADGKFVKNSLSKYNEIAQANQQAAVANSQAQSPTPAQPAQETPLLTLDDYKKSKYFRGVHGMVDGAAVTIDGKKYPIFVMQNRYRGAGKSKEENDRTYAVDPETGKMRRVFENWFGMPHNAWSTDEGGEDWFYPSFMAGPEYEWMKANPQPAMRGPLEGDLTPEYKAWSKKYKEAKATGFKKQGGTMNRINYFQQGGAAPQQDMQKQIENLVKAAMSGDQKATKTINQIMEAAKAGDQQAAQIAQMIQTVAQQMQGQQAPSAKWGSKLQYIRSLKYARGGVACPACQAGAQIPTSQDKAYLKSTKKVEEKACGGKAKKTKKRYFGGWL